MKTFGISVWFHVEADNHEEAWDVAEKFTCNFLTNHGNMSDSGIIDVEEIE